MSDEYLCIYHGNCADGFGAAWAVRKSIPACEFHAGVYQQDPPDVTGKYVILVDFSYPLEVLLKMLDDAYGVLIIDHHKSAMENLKGAPSYCVVDMSEWSGRVCFGRYKENLMLDDVENAGRTIYTYFDMNRSGAMMAWNFFHPDKAAPKLIEHIQDRDLWRFKLSDTKEIQSAVFSYPYEFDVWDELMESPVSRLAQEGESILRKHMKDVRELIGSAAGRMDVAGHNVPALNAPYFYSSEAGNIMSEGEPFAACYWFTPRGVTFSLRSRSGGRDVSEIAKQYGGGGHANAAGFTVESLEDL